MNEEENKISFEGKEFINPAISYETEPPKIIQWVIKYSGGYIKDEKQANYALLVFIVMATVVAIYLFSTSGIEPPPNFPIEDSGLSL